MLFVFASHLLCFCVVFGFFVLDPFLVCSQIITLFCVSVFLCFALCLRFAHAFIFLCGFRYFRVVLRFLRCFALCALFVLLSCFVFVCVFLHLPGRTFHSPFLVCVLSKALFYSSCFFGALVTHLGLSVLFFLWFVAFSVSLRCFVPFFVLPCAPFRGLCSVCF